MKNVLQKLSFVALLSGISFFTNAQGFEPGDGFKQVNFGIGVSGYGIPIYAGFDFGVSENITIGPRLSYRSYGADFAFSDFNYYIFNISFRGDYHFGSLIDDLPSELDLYGGLSLGYSIWGDNYDGNNAFDGEASRVYLAVQAGGRWYFNDHWAGNVEFSGGSLSGLTLGLSYMF